MHVYALTSIRSREGVDNADTPESFIPNMILCKSFFGGVSMAEDALADDIECTFYDKEGEGSDHLLVIRQDYSIRWEIILGKPCRAYGYVHRKTGAPSEFCSISRFALMPYRVMERPS